MGQSRNSKGSCAMAKVREDILVTQSAIALNNVFKLKDRDLGR